MNQEQREKYKRLLRLVNALQLEEWPLAEPGRQDAWNEVVRSALTLGLKIDPDNPDLPAIAAEIFKLLAQPPELPAPNIPPDLDKFLENFEKHLAEERERRIKILSPSQKRLQQQIRSQLVEQFEPLKQNLGLAEDLSYQFSELVKTNLAPVAIEAVFKKEDYQETWRKIENVVIQELGEAGIIAGLTKIRAIEQNLIETTFEQAQDLAARARPTLPTEEVLERKELPSLTPEEKEIIQAEEALEEKIGTEFQTRIKILPYLPRVSRELSREAKEIITAHLVDLHKPITSTEYEKVLSKVWPRIEEEFKKRKLPNPKKTEAEDFVKELAKKSQKEASVLATRAPRPLPKAIITRLEAKTEGVAPPAYWFLFPEWAAYFKQAICGLPRKALRTAIIEAPSEERRRIIQEALSVEDIEASMASLIEKGLPEAHPTIRELEAKKQRILEILTTKRLLSAKDLEQTAKELEAIIAAFKEAGLSSTHPTLKNLETKRQRFLQKQEALVAKEAIDLTPERQKIWEEMIEKGLFAEDLEASITALKEEGLAETHPTIRKLKEKRERFLKVQKVKRVLKNGTVVFEDKTAAKILKGYWDLAKRKGHQIYVREIRAFLPRTSPAAVSGRLQQFLNKFGSVTKLYRKVKLGPGKTAIRPYFSEKLMRFITRHRYSSLPHLLSAIYQKTLGRIVMMIKQSFTNIAIGQAVKVGVQKAAAWFATKAGIELTAKAGLKAGIKAGVSKLGAWAATKLGLAAIPEPLVSKIALVLSFVAEKLLKPIIEKIIKPVWEKIKQIIKEPEKALAFLAAGLAALVLLPMPVALIGVVPIAIGGIGLASFGATSAGTFASGLAGKVTAFFVALVTLPITAPIAIFVIAVISGLSILTFLIVMTTAGAFILPEALPEREPAGPPHIISEYIDVTKTVAPKSQFENNELPVEITYTLTVTAKQEKLINVRITDKTTVTKEINPPFVPERSWTVDEIEVTWSESYNLTLDDRFQDSLITNYVTVTADVENGPADEKATASLIVIVGSPPQDCPSGWPMPSGRITQGPRCPNTHSLCEAIDIRGGTVGVTPIWTTHQGTVSTHPSPAGVYGRYVDVTTVCEGITLTTRYAHLTTINVSSGERIAKGTQVGTYGSSGDPRGPAKNYIDHLHYEFIPRWGLLMQPPYVPVPIPRACCSFSACGSISW